MLEPHYQHTVARILESDCRYVLAIQDQMRLNFTGHKAKSDLGIIGRTGNTDQYGLIQHSVLCVSDQNESLGLMDVQFFDYSEFDTSVDRWKRGLAEKASCCWLDGLQKMRQRLGITKRRIITVADREGDFYEFLHPLIEGNEEFVIRAQHDRYLSRVGDQKEVVKLWDLFEQSADQGTMEASIQDVNSREIKTIILQIKAIRVFVPVPKRIPKGQREVDGYKAFQINVVMAYGDDREWVLLTSLPINTFEQIKEVVEIYQARWHIEDFHKVLKTGYQVDEIYLHSSRQAIENLLAIACISACRLYWIIYMGRHEADIKADQLFETFEWKAMYVFFKEKIPDNPPPLCDVILKIARLGGYKPRHNAKPPGIKTMWIGYQKFTVAAQMYLNMSTKT